MDIILLTNATNSDADAYVTADESGFVTASEDFSDDEDQSPPSAADLEPPRQMKSKKGDGKKKSASKKQAGDKKPVGDKKKSGPKKVAKK